MKKIIVLTSMRTGSTWLTFLVKNLLQRQVGFATNFDEIDTICSHNAVVKAHAFTTEEIFEKYPDAYVLTSVRNPKGRTSSQFYFQKPYTEERLTKILAKNVKTGEQRQLDRMWKGFSSRTLKVDRNPHYIWTTFEWMKENIYRETKILNLFLGLDLRDRALEYIVSRTQRECVTWGIIRKGKVDSWKEEDFQKRLLVLDKHQEMYYNIVNQELIEENHDGKGETI